MGDTLLVLPIMILIYYQRIIQNYPDTDQSIAYMVTGNVQDSKNDANYSRCPRQFWRCIFDTEDSVCSTMSYSKLLMKSSFVTWYGSGL